MKVIREEELTTAGGTSTSSLSSSSSISAAASQSILSLLAASFGSIPVSVAFAYKDLPRFLDFGASTYPQEVKKELSSLSYHYYYNFFS